jgi:hypothetical protein
VRVPDTTALEELAIFQDARDTAATLLALPCVAPKRLIIERAEALDERVLQILEKPPDR